MNNSTIEYINKVAESVRAYYGISYPVTDMVAVVSCIGGSVKEQFGFDDCYDGTIRKVGQNSFAIRIASLQNGARKNFTLAHELGHLFLHMGYKTNFEVWRAQNEA